MDVAYTTNAILIGILAVGTISGLVKGLLRQVIELVGLIGSFFFAIFFSGWMASILQKHLGLPYSPALVVGFITLFIGGMVAAHFAAVSIQKVVSMTFLGWVDRFCGASVGLIVALIVSSLLVSAVLEFPISASARRSVENAEVSLFVRPIAPWLFNAVFSHGAKGVKYREIFRRGGPI